MRRSAHLQWEGPDASELLWDQADEKLEVTLHALAKTTAPQGMAPGAMKHRWIYVANGRPCVVPPI